MVRVYPDPDVIAGEIRRATYVTGSAPLDPHRMYSLVIEIDRLRARVLDLELRLDEARCS